MGARPRFMFAEKVYLPSIENRDRGRRDAFGVPSPRREKTEARQAEVFDLYRLRAPSDGGLAPGSRSRSEWVYGPLSAALTRDRFASDPFREKAEPRARSSTPSVGRGSSGPSLREKDRATMRGPSGLGPPGPLGERPRGAPSLGPRSEVASLPPPSSLGLFLSPHLPIRVEWG